MCECRVNSSFHILVKIRKRSIEVGCHFHQASRTAGFAYLWKRRHWNKLDNLVVLTHDQNRLALSSIRNEFGQVVLCFSDRIVFHCFPLSLFTYYCKLDHCCYQGQTSSTMNSNKGASQNLVRSSSTRLYCLCQGFESLPGDSTTNIPGAGQHHDRVLARFFL